MSYEKLLPQFYSQGFFSDEDEVLEDYEDYNEDDDIPTSEFGEESDEDENGGWNEEDE